MQNIFCTVKLINLINRLKATKNHSVFEPLILLAPTSG